MTGSLLPWFSRMEGEWGVPANPTNQSNNQVVLHLFNAFQDSDDGNELIQAVLSWDGVLGHWKYGAYYCTRTAGCMSSQTFPPAALTMSSTVR